MGATVGISYTLANIKLFGGGDFGSLDIEDI